MRMMPTHLNTDVRRAAAAHAATWLLAIAAALIRVATQLVQYVDHCGGDDAAAHLEA